MNIKAEKPKHDLALSQGNRVRHIRELSGLSRRAFAKNLNFNVSSIQAWEEGRHKKGMSIRNAEKLVASCSELGIAVSIEWLIHGAGEKPLRPSNTLPLSPYGSKNELLSKAIFFKKIREKNIQLLEAIKNNNVHLCQQLITKGANYHHLQEKELYLYCQREDTALHYAAMYAGKTLTDFFINLGLNGFGITLFFIGLNFLGLI